MTRMQGCQTVRLRPINRHLRTGWLIAVALVLGSNSIAICSGMPLAPKHESRHEIDQLEDAWRDAVLSSDTKAMESLLSDDYISITASGTLQNKDQTLANLKSGRVHIASLLVSDRKVRFYGTTAVVTSLATIQATTPDGQVNGNFRYTRVYVRDTQGKWKIVSFEASRVREPGPRKKTEFR